MKERYNHGTKKNLSYKIENENYLYLLIPKDTESKDIQSQEDIINKFFETFNIKISTKIASLSQSSTSPTSSTITTNSHPLRKARKHRNNIIEIWNNIKQYLEDEFNMNDYWKATIKAGYDYNISSKQALPYQQTNKLIKQNKIERISKHPLKWKKVYLKTSEEGVDQMINSLKEGKKIEMKTIS